MKAAFLDKLLERLERLQPEEVQAHLLRLADEKGFLETIFNAIHEGVIVTDLEGRISYLNRAACELCGLDPEKSEGSLLAERLRGLDWNRMIETGTVSSRDLEVFYPQHRFLNFYIVPLTLHHRLRGSESSETFGYAVTLRDITETRRSTEETIQSEKLTALTLLAAGVAHEIGNPLNSLHIHLQVMERKLRKVPDAARKDLQNAVAVAQEEISRLDAIVRQFLHAIRPAALNPSPERINDIVRESVDFLGNEIRDRNIIVEQELRDELPVLSVDRDQLKQAFYNIIKNAFQAMKTDGVLRITTDLIEDWVTISFADTGGGITPENMSKIFEPYHTTKASGTGLGLLIVRRIVREHGGEIDLVSDEGRGLTITIRLPWRDRRARMLPAPSEAEPSDRPDQPDLS